MNNVRFLSAGDLHWTDAMKASVRHKILEPLERYFETADFELSLQLRARHKYLELSLTLRRHDGVRDKIKTVSCRGGAFASLVDDVSSHLRACVREAKTNRSSFFFNHFRRAPAGRREIAHELH